ncbi:ATP-binding protein [Candidatus Poriferisodalis sp.]|uniref:ATP-binding protein n=1 Tax=Candidatus Poriferisodalis sp. TaxID=3101277 RepID=UPI003B01A087
MSELLRVESVNIERWGRASGFKIPLPENDFVVLLGANETGKTSFASALAWLLAGPGDRELLSHFGSPGTELNASLRGRLGSEQITISAGAKVAKDATSHLVKEQQFSASVGGKALQRRQLAAELCTGGLHDYRRFHWVESLQVDKGSDLADRLSAQAVFGGIDPSEHSSKLEKTALEELGAKSGAARKDSARELCEKVNDLDDRFRTIANAGPEWARISDLARQKRCCRDCIDEQMRSLKLAKAAFSDGHVDNVRNWTRKLEQLPSPSPSERHLYDNRENVGEAIARLEEAENECQPVSNAAEQPSDRSWSERRTVAGGIVVALVALLALFVDRRLSGLLVAGACVAAAVLFQRRRSRDLDDDGASTPSDGAEAHRRQRLATVHRMFAGAKYMHSSPTIRGDEPAQSEDEAPASTTFARKADAAPVAINDAASARAMLGAIRERVEGHDRAVHCAEAARTRLREAVEIDRAALEHVANDDPESLDAQIRGLQEDRNRLADGAISVEQRLDELDTRAFELKGLSDEAAYNRLERGQRVTEIRAKIVRGLGCGLAAKLLDDTADSYLSERQPEWLRKANRRASNVADWTGIRMISQSSDGEKQADDEHRLLVDGPRGEHSAHRLSLGARSLLFLMLRLATVAERGEESGVRLPVILDDVLVGLDDDRAKRCIGELREFSRLHQVMLLTCHGSTAELAKEAGANVVTFPPRPSRVGT